MAFRDDIVALVDEVRSEVIDQDLGLRLHTVQTRLREWSGGELGLGTATDTLVTLDPPPKVYSPSPRLQAAAPGKYEDGDRLVRKISATLTEDELTGGALTSVQEFCWLIDGDPYRVVGEPDKRFLEWRVQLRRMVSD